MDIWTVMLEIRFVQTYHFNNARMFDIKLNF